MRGRGCEGGWDVNDVVYDDGGVAGGETKMSQAVESDSWEETCDGGDGEDEQERG